MNKNSVNDKGVNLVTHYMSFNKLWAHIKIYLKVNQSVGRQSKNDVVKS